MFVIDATRAALSKFFNPPSYSFETRIHAVAPITTATQSYMDFLFVHYESSRTLFDRDLLPSKGLSLPVLATKKLKNGAVQHLFGSKKKRDKDNQVVLVLSPSEDGRHLIPKSVMMPEDMSGVVFVYQHSCCHAGAFHAAIIVKNSQGDFDIHTVSSVTGQALGRGNGIIPETLFQKASIYTLPDNDFAELAGCVRCNGRNPLCQRHGFHGQSASLS